MVAAKRRGTSLLQVSLEWFGHGAMPAIRPKEPAADAAGSQEWRQFAVTL